MCDSYSACVVYAKTLFFTLVCVKVVDIHLHFGDQLLNKAMARI